MRQTNHLRLVIVLLISLFLSSRAFAITPTPGNYQLSVSGGIVLPSYSTAIFQNPAAMVSVPGLNLTVQGGAAQSFDDPRTLSGGLIYGNGTVGVGAGGTFISNPNSTDSQGFFGMGVGVSNLSFGISGTTGISPSGGTLMTAGLRFSPSQAWTVGFTAKSFNVSGREWGGGISYSINPYATVVYDASVNQDFKSLQSQPGLIIGSPTAALTVSYGFGSGSSQELSDGFAVGGSLEVTHSLTVQAYYNQLAKYYAVLTFRI